MPALWLLEVSNGLLVAERKERIAVYLELAVRTGLSLATIDGELREAARAEGVEVVAVR